VTAATPLALCKAGGSCALLNGAAYWNLFIGNRAGCIGEVCVAALLLGAAFLFIRRIITWHIPAAYIATVALMSWAFNGKGLFTGSALFFTLAGGLVLGAFFMATDYVTSPLGARGKVVFGIGCGLLTFLIRRFSGYPEGVSYAILMMNAVTPLIDRFTYPRWFGQQRRPARG
jgi:electron transport complex protein RnfD